VQAQQMIHTPTHSAPRRRRLLCLVSCGLCLAGLLLASRLALQVSAAGDRSALPTPKDDMLSIGRLLAWQDELERLPRRWIITHTVTSGDSIWSIAAQYGLDPDTLRWSNPSLARNPDVISLGQQILILPVPGIYYTVKGGETIASLAKAYGVDPEDITGYHLNRLEPPFRLVAGQKLVIPYGRKTIHWPTPSPAPDYAFGWPAVGALTSRFRTGHRAIDVAVAYDAPVYAARSGRVERIDWDDSGYWGFWVVIGHGDGLRSYYAHLKGATVAAGQWVERGQEIGRMGSTGNSTGPHVHFEIRANGTRVDPLGYLPPAP
jgi:murein DD-endopeptidase MepM/ murein hydrolase activator NlpD